MSPRLPDPKSTVPILTFTDLLADPTWRDAVNIRWSDPNDTGTNITDIADETLAYFPAGDPDVAEARRVITSIFDGAPVARLRQMGVAEIKMADVAPGLKGRLGWAFKRGRKLFVVVLHSAFEDNIPGEHLDDGRNAYTELQLLLIRSRRSGIAHYAFSTRRARKHFNRELLNRAVKAYDWKIIIAGKETDVDDLLREAIDGSRDEENTRGFHTATGRGELDDLVDNLYPRNEAGLGFTHRFKRVTVTEGSLSYEKVVGKEVEPRPEAAKVMQAIAPMIAAGEPWEAVGVKAGELGVQARAGVDVKYRTGRTLDQLFHPGHAIKELFARDRLELYLTGKRTVRWHGKIQGGAAYGRHGKPTTYTLDELRSMTPAQRVKAEKGYFEVSLDWEVLMLDGPDGQPCPWGVPYPTWEAVRKRLDAEAAVERPHGAAAHKRDKKPLVGPHEWVVDGTRFAIVSNRTRTYELHSRPADVVGGWKVHPGRTLAVWRSKDHHRAVGAVLAGIAADLGDQVAPLQVHRGVQERNDRPTVKERLMREAADARKEADALTRQADAIPALARDLYAQGLAAAALQQYQAEPELRKRAAELAEHAALLDTRAATQPDTDTGRAEADFGKLAAVAAGLMAYPDQAPYQLADAASAILHNQRARVVDQGLVVELTAVVVLRLADNTVGTYPLTVTVPNRKRGGHDLDSSVFERVARMWFTSPHAISFAELGRRLGWDASEVRRKVAVYLGARGGVPKNMELVERIPSPSLRTALLDCPVAEVRHAIWAALKPSERRVATYLTADYRDHIVRTYLDPDFVWPDWWAGDTHVFRRRLIDLCLAAPQPDDGIRFDAAARALGVAENDIHNWSMHWRVGSGNRAPAYPPTVERVTPFGRHSGALPADRKRVRPIRCPHPDCEGQKRNRGGGWCAVILRVPETAYWAVLCPDCRRMPDPAMRRVRFPESYLIPWEGPRGFGTTNSGRDDARQTVDGRTPPGTV